VFHAPIITHRAEHQSVPGMKPLYRCANA